MHYLKKKTSSLVNKRIYLNILYNTQITVPVPIILLTGITFSVKSKLHFRKTTKGTEIDSFKILFISSETLGSLVSLVNIYPPR